MIFIKLSRHNNLTENKPIINYKELDVNDDSLTKFFLEAYKYTNHQNGYEATPERVKAAQKGFMKCGKLPGHFIISAYEKNVPIGLAWITSRKGKHEAVDVAYFSNLYVNENLRRHGIAIELMRRAAEKAKKQGFKYLEARVRADNIAMNNLKKREGYITDGIEVYNDKEWYWWQLKL